MSDSREVDGAEIEELRETYDIDLDGQPWRDPDVVGALYVDERLSQAQVAEVLDCDRTTAFRWIHHHGLSVEDAKLWTDEGIMFQLYVDEELSESQIAEELGCSQMTVSNWLHKHGIQTRGPSGEAGTESDRPYRNEHVLLDRLEGGDTIRSMAEDFGCSTSTVRYWLDKFDIDAEEVRRRSDNYEPWRDPDRLQKVAERYDKQSQMADELGCDQSTISRWMREYGIAS